MEPCRMSMDRRTNGLVGVVTAMDLPEQAWHGTWCSQIFVGLGSHSGQGPNIWNKGAGTTPRSTITRNRCRTKD